MLRPYDPPVSAVEGRTVTGVRRLGKRIVLELQDDLFVVIHLMIAGRLRRRDPRRRRSRGSAAWPPSTSLGAQFLLTEEGTSKRASIHIVRGESALTEHDRGG